MNWWVKSTERFAQPNNMSMFDVIREILISEKEFTETNYKRLQKALVYIENN